MSIDQEDGNHKTPVLRLRPSVPTELIRPRQQIKQPDGPWIAHPELILTEANDNRHLFQGPLDIKAEEYAAVWKAEVAEALPQLPKDPDDFELTAVLVLGPLTDIERMKNQGMTDKEIASWTERDYVGAHHYLSPRAMMSPSIIGRFGDDWAQNARGIYYRHHYSPGWVTADHSLWLPSFDGTDWDNPSEENCRARAKVFLKHALDNERWNKSEYAWEADAWKDVFGMMREDPALAVDKHEYNTIRQHRYPVTCLLTGQSKFLKRIPDATFGLATFKPQDYQNAVAEWDLDSERLDALLLHRQGGLISDPHWGGSDLVFPFAVYEAKGWKGDPREARRQGCLAGKEYLDMLDKLAQRPGKTGPESGQYQTDDSRNNQVFVFTSYGAHWHVLVGYKRPRLKREYAGHEGMSESVYVFQRIWSGRVTTERRAWELLSFVDQIHLWGVTDFRNRVIQHLKTWHEFVRKCYFNDVFYLRETPNTGHYIGEDVMLFKVPPSCEVLADWTKYATEDARVTFKDRLYIHLQRAAAQLKGSFVKNEFPNFMACGIDDCGGMASGNPGYPTATVDEAITHFREVHGMDDESIAARVAMYGRMPVLERPWPKAKSKSPAAAGDALGNGSSRKRGPEDWTANEIRALKRKGGLEGIELREF